MAEGLRPVAAPRRLEIEELSMSESELDEAARVEAITIEEQIKIIMKRFEDWCQIPVFAPTTETLKATYKMTRDDWRALTEAIKVEFLKCQNIIPEAFEYIARTIKKVRVLMVVKKDSRYKEEYVHANIMLAAMECLIAILHGAVNNEKFYELHYKHIEKSWQYVISDFVTHSLNTEPQLSCMVLDVFAAMGPVMFERLPEPDQVKIQAFLITHGGEQNQLTANMKAKILRCLGKLIEFPSLREDRSFFTDVLAITERGVMSGERDVKISAAWTFANLTDVVVEGLVATPVTETYETYCKKLFDMATTCTEVHIRGRYNACRACANLLKWISYNTVVTIQMRQIIANLTKRIQRMVGFGLDYKLRWNAAYALGCAFGNEVFCSIYSAEITDPLIKVLAKWCAQSQNYKERTQCVRSLMKISARKTYASTFSYVFDRLCMSLSSLPVEECDNGRKFQIEGLLLLFHLLNVMENDDVDMIQESVINYVESLHSCVTECSPEIPHDRLDEALAAKDNLMMLLIRIRTPQSADCLNCLLQVLKPALGRD